MRCLEAGVAFLEPRLNSNSLRLAGVTAAVYEHHMPSSFKAQLLQLVTAVRLESGPRWGEPRSEREVPCDWQEHGVSHPWVLDSIASTTHESLLEYLRERPDGQGLFEDRARPDVLSKDMLPRYGAAHLTPTRVTRTLSPPLCNTRLAATHSTATARLDAYLERELGGELAKDAAVFSVSTLVVNVLLLGKPPPPGESRMERTVTGTGTIAALDGAGLLNCLKAMPDIALPRLRAVRATANLAVILDSEDEETVPADDDRQPQLRLQRLSVYLGWCHRLQVEVRGRAGSGRAKAGVWQYNALELTDKARMTEDEQSWKDELKRDEENGAISFVVQALPGHELVHCLTLTVDTAGNGGTYIQVADVVTREKDPWQGQLLRGRGLLRLTLAHLLARVAEATSQPVRYELTCDPTIERAYRRCEFSRMAQPELRPPARDPLEWAVAAAALRRHLEGVGGDRPCCGQRAATCRICRKAQVIEAEACVLLRHIARGGAGGGGDLLEVDLRRSRCRPVIFAISGERGRAALKRLASLSITERALAYSHNVRRKRPLEADVEQAARPIVRAVSWYRSYTRIMGPPSS